MRCAVCSVAERALFLLLLLALATRLEVFSRGHGSHGLPSPVPHWLCATSLLPPLTPCVRAQEPELSIPFDDVTLSYFVFARKSDVTRAAELFRNHCKWRAEFDIANLDMVGIKRLLMSGLFGFLPADLRGPASEGVGFIYAAHAPDEMLTDAKLAMQMMWFVTDRLFRLNLDNARHGFTYVEDFTGITFGRIIHMARNSGNKDRFDALQDHMPGRFRKFILTNAPLWIRIPFKMMVLPFFLFLSAPD